MPHNRKRYQRPAHGRPGYRRRRRINTGRFTVFLIIVAAIVVGVTLLVMYLTGSGLFKPTVESNPTPTATPAPYGEPAQVETQTPPEATQEQAALVVAADSAQPSNFGFETDVWADGQIVDSYTRQDAISFPDAVDYTGLKGVTTFRGNNYRAGGSYGAVNVAEEKLEKVWDIDSGALTRWSGSGWTGQPLIVEWDADMRQMMNLYPEKKSKDTLVEVIYPTMDGKIYFLDLDNGEYTRDPIDLGFTVKGTASIDPRGYPLLYVGQGVGMEGDYSWDNSYLYIYSLIDGEVLYKYGAEQKDEFAYRESWQAYDSSPLVCADADTLVWPGENGVLYTIQLNSEFDRAAGTVSVSPSPGQPVKYRYTTPLNADDEDASFDTSNGEKRWWGMESSAVAWKNYLYFTDNGGWLQCVDLNTMELVFAQDLSDDTDATPVLEVDGGNVYLYTGSQVDNQLGEEAETGEGTAYIRKINALTGEIMWEVSYDCYYIEKLAGGVFGSPVLGQGDLAGFVIFPVARVGSENGGVMVALNTQTGEKIWEIEMRDYSWSSPVAVYTPEGKGYLIQCDSGSDMVLRDGLTGEALSVVSLNGNVEATPAVFNDMVVVGSRGEKIYGVRIS
ncbi:PQQ-binding-like beta-propeller repeat protein [Christensenellaceae bacterium OttesenSCG-928-K19]|nr:PQQ-binding-like beta-propeller repeat protein [Christensenellaceae bacterium OttesenSCG-928-K19]